MNTHLNNPLELKKNEFLQMNWNLKNKDFKF